MRSQRYRTYAHSNTYLIGNVLLILILWIGTTALLWNLLLLWWFVQLVLSLIALFVLAYLEHKYCTGIVARIVERYFPNKEATELYYKNTDVMQQAHRKRIPQRDKATEDEHG